MKAWHLTATTGPGALAPVDLPDPVAGPGEVVLRLRAASLNSRDLAVAGGSYRGGGMACPLVPLSDGAGEVESLGPNTAGVAPGDRVAVTFFPRWLAGPPRRDSYAEAFGAGGPGMLAEKIAVRAETLVPVPPGWSFEEAATLPCAGVTAWNALTGGARPGPGATVPTLGTGGVSIFAIQLARAMGADVVATTGSEDKRARLEAVGARATVNYRTREDWDEAVLEATGGEGADIAVEVGGPGTLERSINALRLGGQVALIGVLAGPGSINPLGLWRRSAVARGVFVGSREMFVELNGFLAAHGIRPVIDRVFAFAEAREAYDHLASGRHFGKVCITI